MCYTNMEDMPKSCPGVEFLSILEHKATDEANFQLNPDSMRECQTKREEKRFEEGILGGDGQIFPLFALPACSHFVPNH
jgi:hypothetical protein